MPNCAIYGCSNTNRKTAGTSIKYYSFPRNENLSKYWIQACRRKDKINLKYAKICSIHFSPNCFQISLKHQLLNYTPRSYRNLKDDAIPTEYLPSKMNKSKLGNRTMRINKRNELKDRKQILDDPSAADPDVLPPVNIVVEAEVLEIDKYQGILVNVNELLQEMIALKNKLNTAERDVELLKSQNEILKTEKESFNLQISNINANLGNILHLDK